MQIASFTLSAEPPQTHSALKIEQAFNEIWAAEFRRLLFNVKVSLLITKLLLLFCGRVFAPFPSGHVPPKRCKKDQCGA